MRRTALSILAAATCITTPLTVWSAMPGAQPPLAIQAARPLLDAATELLKERAHPYGGTVHIHVTPPRITREAACEDLSLSVAGNGRLQNRTTIRAQCHAPQAWTLYLKAQIRIVRTYFVTNRRIERGEILSLDHLDTREGDILRHPKYLTDPSMIIDWVATRPISSGAPLEASALRHPDSIERGQTIQTRIAGPGFEMTGTAQAIEPGLPGATIQIRVPSGKIMTATVIDAHSVRIPL